MEMLLFYMSGQETVSLASIATTNERQSVPRVKQLTAPSPLRLEHLGLVLCYICSRGSAENNKVKQ